MLARRPRRKNTGAQPQCRGHQSECRCPSIAKKQATPTEDREQKIQRALEEKSREVWKTRVEKESRRVGLV